MSALGDRVFACKRKLVTSKRGGMRYEVEEEEAKKKVVVVRIENKGQELLLTFLTINSRAIPVLFLLLEFYIRAQTHTDTHTLTHPTKETLLHDTITYLNHFLYQNTYHCHLQPLRHFTTSPTTPSLPSNKEDNPSPPLSKHKT